VIDYEVLTPLFKRNKHYPSLEREIIYAGFSFLIPDLTLFGGQNHRQAMQKSCNGQEEKERLRSGWSATC
jgi:hypothetical protein